MSTAAGLPGYLGYWGKAHPLPDASCGWHPLAYHSLDVAAVARELLLKRPFYRAAGARLLGMAESDLLSFAPAFIALHDLGKIEAAFQRKAPEAGMTPGRIPTLSIGHHTKAGLALWMACLDRECAPMLAASVRPRMLDDLARAVFGHHGRPVQEDLSRDSVDRFFDPQEIADARSLAADLIHAFATVPVPVPTGDAAKASWWLAGLATLADWVGSNARWFPYAPPKWTLTEYHEVAAVAASTAVAGAGLAACGVRPLQSFRALTARDSRELQPTPAQEWAEHVPLPTSGPVLCIVEDVTGSGKTEAAQMLVHRLLADGRCGGAYWAMPTMATANAMYQRQAGFVARLYDAARGTPSLVLAHGQAAIDPAFTGTIVDDPTALAVRADGDDEDTSSVQCASWLASDRRRALLADVGAGTIDQALLGVLPTRFNVLRLAGLSGKVVVLDEVHAYDAYVGTLLEELLEFLAGVGACVVLLSATLPMKKRFRMLEAWHRGAHARGAPLLPETAGKADYPCAAITGTSGAPEFTAVAAATGSRRVVQVQRLSAVSDALGQAAARLANGEAVALIRNTVRECQETAELARSLGLDPVVFHARYAHCDRQRIERDVLRRLGPTDSADRAGTFVIATQVIEQSLDIDFDWMITDLAPIDLLLQRAGRLHRHTWRSRASAEPPTLTVLEPKDRDGAPDAWRSGLGGTASVYAISALYGTSRLLDDSPVLVSPDGNRDMIEAVYDESRAPELPDPLRKKADAQRSKAMAHGHVAQQLSLSLPEGYGRRAAYLDESVVSTRLGEPTTVVRLARRANDGRLVPWCDDPDRSSADLWQLSELRVLQRTMPTQVVCEGIPAEVRLEIAGGWRTHEQDGVLVLLEPTPEGAWLASVRSTVDGWQGAVSYDRRDGLILRPPYRRK